MTYSDLDKILSKRNEFVSLSKLHKKRLIKLIIGVMNGDYKHRSFFLPMRLVHHLYTPLIYGKDLEKMVMVDTTKSH